MNETIQRVTFTDGGTDSTGEPIPADEVLTPISVRSVWPLTDKESVDVGVVDSEEVLNVLFHHGEKVNIGDLFIVRGRRYKAINHGFDHVSHFTGRQAGVLVKMRYIEPRSEYA